MKRNRAIEIMRLFAAVVIVAVHINEFFGGGIEHLSNFLSIYVEFFFMTSGFFMMQHLDKRSNEIENTWGFTVHKIKTFWAPLCIVNFVHLFLNCCMSKVGSIGDVLSKFWHFKWEFLLLQCAGFIQSPAFNQDYLIGPNWFLSALVLATMVLYPIAKHYRRAYVNIVCPAIILSVYCGIMQTYGNMNIGNGFRFLVMDALARGLAGICCGSICYCAYRTIEKKESNLAMSIIDYIGWGMIPVSILIGIFGKDDSSLFMIIPFGIVIISGMLNFGGVAKILNAFPADIAVFCGKFSLYVYLTHWTAIFAVMFLMPAASSLAKVVVSVIITVVYSLLLYFFDKKRKNEKTVLMICLGIFVVNLLTSGLLGH